MNTKINFFFFYGTIFFSFINFFLNTQNIAEKRMLPLVIFPMNMISDEVTKDTNFKAVSAISQLPGRIAPETLEYLDTKEKVRGGRCVPTEGPPTFKLVPGGSRQSEFEIRRERT
jgi:hypothetical protein